MKVPWYSGRGLQALVSVLLIFDYAFKGCRYDTECRVVVKQIAHLVYS